MNKDEFAAKFPALPPRFSLAELFDECARAGIVIETRDVPPTPGDPTVPISQRQARYADAESTGEKITAENTDPNDPRFGNPPPPFLDPETPK